MYVEPNSTIRMLRNVPLDNTYNHTIYFSNATAQVEYFEGRIKYTFDRQSYQRLNRGYIRLNRKADDLYDCNYVMYQNTAYGYKWFYAFVTSVEYINDNVSEVRFEIDEMQTWHFNYQLDQCFVEREHSTTDVAGENTVPEDLELGEYVSETKTSSGHFNSYNVVIAATFDNTFADATGFSYGGIYSGLRYTWFPCNSTGIDGVNQFLAETARRAKTDGIVSIFMMPSDFCTSPDNPPETPALPSYSVVISKPTTLGSYTPRNKKLLTYPYNMLYVTHYGCDSCALHYELFEQTTNCRFALIGNFNPNPAFMLYPIYYAGQIDNIEEGIIYSGVPQCAYNVDVFKEWLSRTAARLPFDMVSNATGLVAGIQRSKSISAALGTDKSAGLVEAQKETAKYGALSYVSGVVGSVVEHSIKPQRSAGSQGSDLYMSMRDNNFYLFQKHIRPEYARIIDDYFDMFGYATHRVKIPNRNVRPYWNYVKTGGCNINGSIPADSANKICSIYDNGITFWMSGSYVGNYSFDNSPR